MRSSVASSDGKVRRLLCRGDTGERNSREGDAQEESAERHSCAGRVGRELN